ncbi:MAG: helix-turn-helix domain-containing protein [Calothrix sp. CSU_2_0]|nr:helix-turn-helix domain-containing protein [Calothrix sp. CSU_2_0]
MIRWRLRMLMAEKKISNKELAELAELHPTSISKLKKC